MSRIRWTDKEVHDVAKAFVSQRLLNPWMATNQLLAKVEAETLPIERRRNCASIQAYGEALKTAIEEQMDALHKVMNEPKVALDTTPITPVVPPPVNIAEKEIVFVEVQVPVIREVYRPVDNATALAQIPAHEVVGAALLKLFPMLGHTIQTNGNQPKDGYERMAGRAHRPTEQPPPVVLPKPTNQKRVLIVGCPNDMEHHVKEKAQSFKNLELRFIDQDHNVGTVSCDFCVVMHKFAHRSQSEAARQRLSAHIHYVDGGQSELLRKLNDLNALQPAN